MEQESEPAEATTHAAKKRKTVEKKTVVTVKIGEKTENLFKNEGLPSDLWSWRKYGQKPIKGSPYPRGYYRCSTCKGCSAKKQIERCRTDASLLIITYSNIHNHPDPNEQISYRPIIFPGRDLGESAKNVTDLLFPGHDLGESAKNVTDLLFPGRDLSESAKNVTDPLLAEEKPVRSDPLSISAVGFEKESDFFEELEELPMSSGFTNLVLNDDVSNEKIPAVPS